ncbi:MAG: tryptophanase [Candidatus Thermoplasmatota archaeon]|nr:tryptophanase [Candidatus Thermoplasmatota archaeon]
MSDPEPFKIKMVKPLKRLSKEEREERIREAGYNVFKLRSEDVFIDLLTDSGTSAMSDQQVSEMVKTEQAYAGGDSYHALDKTVKEIFGFDRFVIVHQGRAAENVLFSVLLEEGDYVPNNMHFDTTKANTKHKGGEPVDLAVDEAYDPEAIADFKGNMDVKKLERFIEEKGPKNIPVIMLTITNNTGGGQPVSMENIRKVSEVAEQYDIPFFLDACRFAENARFIKEREKGYEDKSIREITREMFSHADGFTFSAKKEGLVNIGGLIGIKDEELHKRCKNLSIIIEGFPTYGGLACRELTAISTGLKEATKDEYQTYRYEQVKHLADSLLEEDIPIIEPVGGHAVFVDAERFLPHIPQTKFPAQALTTELYKESGIRAVELGTSAFGETDEEGDIIPAEMENMRLAIPRRVYTLNQLEYVAGSIKELHEKREDIQGLKRTYAPELLGHFTAEFEPSD